MAAPEAFPGDLVESSLPDRFFAQVERHPERTAVDGRTYRQLARDVMGVAGALCGPHGRVALLLPHGRRMVEAILGTLAANHAYVPLDPTFPAERLRAVLDDAAAGTLLTSAAHLDLAAVLGGPGLRVLDVDEIGPSSAPPVATAGPDTVAYVLFTSGSTGRPKGVAQTHRNVLFQVHNHASGLSITPDDRVSLVSSFGFDASVTDLFGALLSGAEVVPFDVRRHGAARLAAVLGERRVTVYHSTPTLYRHLMGALGPDDVLEDLRIVLLGGEPVSRADVVRCRRHCGPACVFVNGYGATEVSFALRHQVRSGDGLPAGAVPLGRALPGIEVTLLGEGGYHGEIALRSRYVAPGYWRCPEATAERFVEHSDGTWTYRTGDVARRLADGSLVSAGRTDRQLKVRGHRVEPGEVEAALREADGVVAAAVIAGPPDALGTRSLVAYVVPAPGGAFDAIALRRTLAGRLPDYMVPAAFQCLDELPLTPTGKVDTRALPGFTPEPAAPPAQPHDELERVVAGAWLSALGRPPAALDQSFFDAGGHSLLLEVVQREVERALGREVPLVRLFEHPTVASLAGFLRDGQAPGAVEAARERMARRRAAAQRR